MINSNKKKTFKFQRKRPISANRLLLDSPDSYKGGNQPYIAEFSSCKRAEDSILMRNLASAGVEGLRKMDRDFEREHGIGGGARLNDDSELSGSTYGNNGDPANMHKCASVGAHARTVGAGPSSVARTNMLMMNGLESIESDKEGEDAQRISWQQFELLRKERIKR